MPTKPKQAAPLSREDEVLRRMLNMPPQPHKPKLASKSAKAAVAKKVPKKAKAR